MERFTICSMIKNETLGLNDWILHHLDLGFNHIYLFEDFNSVSHDYIVNQYKGSVTLQRICDIDEFKSYEGNPRRRIDLFNWFIRTQCEDIEWCAFIDIDEYINMDNKQYGDLTYLFDRHINRIKTSLALSQQFFNSNNYMTHQDNCQEAYKFTYYHENLFGPFKYVNNLYGIYNIENEYWKKRYKQFVHVSNVRNDEVLFEDDINYFHDCGNVIYTKIEKPENKDELESYYESFNNNISMIWINHYYTKSLDDFIVKVQRGSIDNNNPLNWKGFDIFFDVNDKFKTIEYYFLRIIKDSVKFDPNIVLSDRYNMITSYNIKQLNKIDKEKEFYKQAILYICHTFNYESVCRYFVLYESIKDNPHYDLYWAYDGNSLPLTFFDMKLQNYTDTFKIFLFKLDTLKDKYKTISYAPDRYNLNIQTDNIDKIYSLPNCNLIAQEFMSQNKQYDFCWGIEYDVVHTSNWEDFWEQWESNTKDYLASNISLLRFTHYQILYDKNYVTTDDGKIYQSLNAIFRLSRSLSEYLDDFYINNSGFYETTIATLCIKNNFTIEDIGGDYEFTDKNNINNNYITYSATNNIGTLGTQIYTQDEYNYFCKYYKGILLHECKLDTVTIFMGGNKRKLSLLIK